MLTASTGMAARTSRSVAKLSSLQLAAIGAGATVFLICIVSGAKVLGDPDTYWHIAAGRWMLDHLTWPTTDLYSHTFEGHRWIAKEWFSQILLAVAWLTGSWNGVVALSALSACVTVAMITLFVGARTSVASGLVMAALSLFTFAPVMIARPLLIVFPIIVAWTITFARSAEAGRRPPWLALPLLLLWANMHGAFTMGIVIAAAFGLEALLRVDAENRPRVAKEWIGFGLACIAVTMVTPYGWEPLWVNVIMANKHEVLPYLSEWQSADFSPRWIFLGGLVIACIWALAADMRANAARILLIGFLAYAMFRHQRLAMVFALVMPIIAGPALMNAAAKLMRRAGLFQSGFDLSPSMARGIAGTLAAGAAVAAATLSSAPPPSVTAEAALASVPRDVRSQRAFNSHDLGGFLIHNGVRTFFDGRNDQLFTGGFFTRVMEATTSTDPEGLANLLDERRIRWALILKEKPEAQLFPKLDGWRRHFGDATSEVWFRAR